MGIFSCILHRRILGTLAGRHKNSRAAISPAFAAGRAHGRRGAAVAVILKGEFHSDAVRGAAAPERLGAGTCRGPGPPLLPVRREWLACSGETGQRGDTREYWPAHSRPPLKARVAPVDRPAAVWRRALQQPAAHTGEGARRQETPRVGRGAACFRSGDRFRPFLVFHALEWARPRKTPVRAPESL